MKTYEAMLLVEPTIAAKEWTRVPEEVDRIVKRHGAAVLSVVKFGERKLAYPVKKSNRGAYVVAYFTSPEKVLGKIKADFQLSEVVMRSLILAHDGDLRKEPPRDFETAGPLIANGAASSFTVAAPSRMPSGCWRCATRTTTCCSSPSAGACSNRGRTTCRTPSARRRAFRWSTSSSANLGRPSPRS